MVEKGENVQMATVSSKKPNVLALFKSYSPGEFLVVNKFSHEFNVSILYLSDLVALNGYKKTLSIINEYILFNKINIIVIDVEYYPEFDFEFIRNISNSVVKVSIVMDDALMHDFNSITAAYSDLILTVEPISVLLYRAKGFKAEFMPLEGDQSVFYERDGAKDIDVLFCGTMSKCGRKEYINYLRANGVAVTVIGHGSNFVPFEELGAIISRTKIVLDLSKSRLISSIAPETKLRPAEEFFSYLLGMRGRPIVSGLCKTACISEYAPSLSLLFSEDEVPTFTSFKECLDLTNLLLEDENRLAYHAEKLHSKVIAEYEDRAYMKKLLPKIRKREPFVYEFKPLPHWYVKLVAKARVRRLSSFPFRHIYEILSLLWSRPRLTLTLHKEICITYIAAIYRRVLPVRLREKRREFFW